jgi:tRNA-dihydrouridine synthase C
MLGRGLLAQPGLALQIKADGQGQPRAEMDWPAACKLLYHYHLQTYNHYPAKHMGNRVKQWLNYLGRNYPQAQRFMETIKRSRDAEVINEQFELELGRIASKNCAIAVV